MGHKAAVLCSGAWDKPTPIRSEPPPFTTPTLPSQPFLGCSSVLSAPILYLQIEPAPPILRWMAQQQMSNRCQYGSATMRGRRRTGSAQHAVQTKFREYPECFGCIFAPGIRNLNLQRQFFCLSNDNAARRARAPLLAHDLWPRLFSFFPSWKCEEYRCRLFQLQVVLLFHSIIQRKAYLALRRTAQVTSLSVSDG